MAAPLRRMLASGLAGADPLSPGLAPVAAVPAARDHARGGLLFSKGAALLAGPPAWRPDSGLKLPRAERTGRRRNGYPKPEKQVRGRWRIVFLERVGGRTVFFLMFPPVARYLRRR